MAEEQQDIFGKIDALFERRVGFASKDPRGRVTEDFPLLTDVVSPGQRPAVEERRKAERRRSERRQDWSPDQAGLTPTFTDAQFARFLSVFERKLEDLFIRQQLRMEESIANALRQAVRGKDDG